MKIVIAVVSASILATPGIRLLRLRLRNGSGPERWLSAFFLGLAIGIPLRLNLIGHPDISAGWLKLLSAVALAGLITAGRP